MGVKNIKNLVFSLSVLLVVSGCSLKKENLSSDTKVDLNIETTSFNYADIDAVIEKLSKYEIDYKNNDFSITDVELDKLKEIADNDYKCSKDNITDTVSVINKIKENSTIAENHIKIFNPDDVLAYETQEGEIIKYYVDSNGNDVVTSITSVDGVTVDYIKNETKSNTSIFNTVYGDRVLEILTDSFNHILDSNTNYNDDYHLFDEVKIMAKTNGDLVCYIASDNSIFINIDLLNRYEKNGEDYLTANLKYIINLLREIPCPCINDIYTGVNYNSDIDNNVLNIIASLNGVDLSNINSSGNTISSNSKELFLLSLFSKKNITDFYDAIYNNDYKELWSFFDLKDDEEIKDFYKILISIDNKFLLDDEYISNEYKLTLFKNYLINLLEYHNENELSLDENLLLLEFGKDIIMSDCKLTPFEDNYSFYSQFRDLINIYKSFLSSYYDISLIDLDKKEDFIDTSMINDYIEKYPNLELVLEDRFYPSVKYSYIYSDMDEYNDSVNKVNKNSLKN